MRTRALLYYELAEGVFEIDEFDCVSIFVIVGEERALVIDTGTGIGDLRWVIEHRITEKPYDVILSHCHLDHAGGSGFFDSVWVHKDDADLDNPPIPITVEKRKWYANLIQKRENKNYAYDPETDIVEWPKKPEIKILEDKQVFDLGGRKVTIYHCPGHTPGECAAIDDKTKTLFIGDACNCNFLLGNNISISPEESVRIAHAGLKRLYEMKGTAFEKVYNGHHDYRGFGSPLADDVLPNTITCLEKMLDGTATILQVKDQLSDSDSTKKVAEYKNVQITWPRSIS